MSNKILIPTPILPKDLDYDHVYEPAEDSFALLDAIEEDLFSYPLNDTNIIGLEIGTGSGIAITFLGHLIKKLNINGYLMATDLNPIATKSAKLTSEINKVKVDIIQTDLIQSLLPKINYQIDILLFNPPYVPTDESEIFSSNKLNQTNLSVTDQVIAGTWAGGLNGRTIIDQLLPNVKHILSNSGRFYLVTVKENQPEQLCKEVEKFGLKGEIILIRKAGREKLHILKITHL